MAAQVAHRAVAEVPPAVPLGPGEVDLVERPLRRGAEPQVPVEERRRVHRLLRAFGDVDDVLVALGGLLALQAPRAVDPDVGLADRADHAGLDDLDDPPVIVGRVHLDAHLRREIGLERRGLADLAGLVDVVGQRLFAVHVLAVLEGQQDGGGVGVLAGADDHRVEGVGLVEELAEVGILRRLGLHLGALLDGAGVDVAEGDDVFRLQALEVGPAAAAAGDHRDAHLGVEVLAAEDRGEAEGGGGRAGDAPVERTAGDR